MSLVVKLQKEIDRVGLSYEDLGSVNCVVVTYSPISRNWSVGDDGNQIELSKKNVLDLIKKLKKVDLVSYEAFFNDYCNDCKFPPFPRKK